MKFFKWICFLLLSVRIGIPVHAETISWAETTLQTMSQEEKIGQLFMIAAYVDSEFAQKEIGNPNIIQDIDHYISQYFVGGLAFVGPSEWLKQVTLTNRYQALSKYPLLIAQDLEWGLGMRIKDGLSFPKNITLGSVVDNRLIYEMGKEVGRQAKLIGVHMNLSPVLDVNIEPENLVINVRSFGSSPQLVAEKGIAMIRGLQEAGVIASAKHFPGLGDITVDPHLGLPYSLHEKKRLQEVELYPFVEAIKAGVLSIQTEHLIVPALESDRKIPASLSAKVVHDLLKDAFSFTGLVLSGALRMKALTDQYSDEEILLKAFLAGSDMLLMPQDLPKAFHLLKSALAEGKITEKEVEERVLKILKMKERVKLDQQSIVPIPTAEQLASPHALALKRQLFESAVTIKRDSQQLLPLSTSNIKSVAYIQLGDVSTNSFLEQLNQNLTVDSFFFPLEQDHTKERERLWQCIDNYSLIILAVYPADPRRIVQIRLLNADRQREELKQFRVHGMTESFILLLNALKAYQEKTVVAFFGNPFGIHFFADYQTVIMAYEADPDAQHAAIQLLSTGCSTLYKK